MEFKFQLLPRREGFLNFITLKNVGRGDWIWAGRSGDRILAAVKFSTPIHTDPGAHLQWIPGFISGE
jgi:hypothetical protein